LLTDTQGLIWARRVTAANVSDAEGFRLLILAALPFLARLVKVYVDRGYARSLWSWLIAVSGGRCLPEWVQPVAGQVGFAVQPKRWIVERSIAWLCWSRRLSKDYEQTTSSSQAWIDVSAIRSTLRKLQRD
jgi:transposase